MRLRKKPPTLCWLSGSLRKRWKEKDVRRYTCLRNDACSAALPSLQRGCNYAGRTLDVAALTENQRCCVWEGWGDLLGALFQRLDQHLLEGADLLQVSQNQRHIRAAEPETHTQREASWSSTYTFMQFSNSVEIQVWRSEWLIRTCQRFEEPAGNLSGGSEDPLSILSRFPKYSATPGM